MKEYFQFIAKQSGASSKSRYINIYPFIVVWGADFCRDRTKYQSKQEKTTHPKTEKINQIKSHRLAHAQHTLHTAPVCVCVCFSVPKSVSEVLREIFSVSIDIGTLLSEYKSQLFQVWVARKKKTREQRKSKKTGRDEERFHSNKSKWLMCD